MKLTQEDLELQVLKHLLDSKEAVAKIIGLNITEENFYYVEEGYDKCLTANMFKLIIQYYNDSDGCLVTELVMENKMVERGMKDATRARFILLWAKIQEQETNPNEFHDLVMLLKKKRVIKIIANMMEKGANILASEEDGGIDKFVEHIEKCLDDIQTNKQTEAVNKHSFDVTDVAESFSQEYRKQLKAPKGIPCGLKQIDDLTFGWQPGEVITLVALSSGGKSIQMLNWAHHAHSLGYNVLFMQFEMKWWDCLLRHLSLMLRVPFFKLRGLQLTEEELKYIVTQLQELKGQNYFEYDINLEDPTPEYVDSKIRQLILTKGKPDILICDYIGEMSVRNAPSSWKDYEHQQAALGKLQRLAAKFEIPVITAQQVNRDAIREHGKSKSEGKQYAFNQASMAGGQKLIYKSTYVIAIDSNRDDKTMTYLSLKNRHSHFDVFGANVDPLYNAIVEMTDDEQKRFLGMRGLLKEDDAIPTPDSVTRPIINLDEDGEMHVESRGVVSTINREELTIDTSDWDLD